MNSENFLPLNYTVPDKQNGYMKFKPGENKFRIVSSPIIGWEWWVEQDGGRHPMRVRTFDEVPADYAGEAKHFWAMKVWNYEAKQLQILEISQKGIQEAIKGLVDKASWGSPLAYDLIIDRTGEGLDTKYTVSPEPKAEVPLQAHAAIKAVSINLDALYEGKDPFTANEKTGEDVSVEPTEDINPDEIAVG